MNQYTMEFDTASILTAGKPVRRLSRNRISVTERSKCY